MRRSIVRIASTVALFAIPHGLVAQTREFLDAPLVKAEIRVQWDADAKTLTYAVDEDPIFRALPSGKVFLTKSSVFVTYPRINPLRVQATAAVSTVDDPSHATITKLLEAIMNVATIVKPETAKAAPPTLPGQPPSCDTSFRAARDKVAVLANNLYGDSTKPAAIKRDVDDWIAAIDSAYRSNPAIDGSSAINEGAKKIDTFVQDLDKSLKIALETITTIENEATTGKSSTNPCDVAVNTVYQLAVLDYPRSRLDQLTALRSAAAALRDTLVKDYVSNGSKWILGSNYKISSEIGPTAAKMQNVVIKVVNVDFKVNPSSSALVVAQEDAGSGTLTVRKYSPLAPEVGVGAVFGSLTRAQYGTSKNAAGQTIVSRIPDDRVSLQPSVLVNFVCRCAAGPFVSPMFQVGASTSKELPAILLGGGLRLFGFGQGDVAVGGGVMFGWTKVLQTLKEGDVVSGTKDIEADKGYPAKPRTGGYFVIQYKF